MINEFRGKYRFLSNFFSQKVPVVYENITYPTVEHFYQAMKATNEAIRLSISQLQKGPVKYWY